MKTSTLLFIILCVALNVFSQAGTLDSTFSGDGIVLTGQKKFYPNAMLIQPNGRIVIGGSGINATHHFMLFRYMPNGRLDSSFGINGEVDTKFKNQTESFIESLALQKDEKIVAAGTVDTPANVNDIPSEWGLAQYKQNGDIDSNFGKAGKITTDFPGYADTRNPFIAIQQDGKIVVAGSADSALYHNQSILIKTLALARYKKNGDLDNSFGNKGLVNTRVDSLAFAPSSIIILKNRKILIGCFAEGGNNSILDLVQYNPDGSLDSSFGINGIAVSKFNNLYNITGCYIALQPGGAIVIGASADIAFSSTDFLLIRYKSSGNFDSSFGNNGIALTNFDNKSSFMSGIAIQTNGKIVAAGYDKCGCDYDMYNVDNDFVMCRYDKNGNLDTQFGNNGKVVTDLGGHEGANAIALQSDEKIVLTGDYKFDVTENRPKIALLRYIGDSTSPSFTDNIISQNQNAIANKSTGIYLSPNPANNIVSIHGLSSESNNTISLIDNTGKTLQTVITAANNYSFNIQQLPAGIYFIKINDKKNVTTLKFIKE